jgi:transposase
VQDRDLYARILGLAAPWEVTDVKLNAKSGEICVTVSGRRDATFVCPKCNKRCSGYDSLPRRWRHLDTCQFKTILAADVPRVSCPEHGVIQVHVPWAESGSRFTALMEAVVIDWLRSLASIKAVAKQMRLTWDEVDGIMQRAVARGLLRRKRVKVYNVGVDETSFRKRHRYVTIVTDLDESVVLHVVDDRKQEGLDSFFRSLTPSQIGAIQTVAMDMWGPYIASTREHVPDADHKIAFDKFHVAKHLGDAVDRVRRMEHKARLADGDTVLRGTRYLWLTRRENLDDDQADEFAKLHSHSLKTSRAWALKETAMSLWKCISRGRAERHWLAWISKAVRSRLEPIKKAARMIRRHLFGILNAVTSQATNAGSESINAKVQKVKAAACGFRSPERFRNAILFHLGGLKLYPAGVSATHTNA